ncbi:hypothetical protein ACIBI7_07995 [Nonomuraea fuscirosea]|uniref:hypothetical protein n=1 Tax=Nonomuraea fuscirosea TaxID=1291556 RepID=UPI003787F785
MTGSGASGGGYVGRIDNAGTPRTGSTVAYPPTAGWGRFGTTSGDDHRAGAPRGARHGGLAVTSGVVTAGVSC